ncbi:MAG: DNA polymerase I, partial [Candidatus Kerfeldbacteria bacterium]|nr:DNA polymerase I [Candidatus Kerfeldbacteria bacterium]
FRELTKLQSTYVEALPELVRPETSRVHTSYNQTIAATGRLSSSNPNLQNIPVRTEEGREIRKAFIAPSKFQLLSIDYSQMELRIAASLSNDQKMLEIFRSHLDIHKQTAAEIHNVPVSRVTPEMRYAAKEVNFGVLYGMGAFGLAWRAGISRHAASEFIRRYFEVFSGIREYVEQAKELAVSRGYAETLLGRRRYIPELRSHNGQLRAAGERMAVNMPIQGLQADLLKLAMIEVDRRLPRISERASMILQVHDELVFEVPRTHIRKVASAVKEIMENVYELRVPIVAECKVGDNWGEMQKLDV